MMKRILAAAGTAAVLIALEMGCSGDVLTIPDGMTGVDQNGEKCTAGGALHTLKLSPETIRLSPGARVPVSVRAVYENGCSLEATESVYMTLNSTSVAKIGRDIAFSGASIRYVEGVAEGTTTLVASTEKGGKGVSSLSSSIQVTDCSEENSSVTSLMLMPSALDLTPGSSEPVHVYAAWKSGCVFDATKRVYFNLDDESVAKLQSAPDGSRVVTGLEAGTANLFASVRAGGEGMKSGVSEIRVSTGGGSEHDQDAGLTDDDGPASDAGLDPYTPDAGTEDADGGMEESDGGSPAVTLRSLTIYPSNLQMSPVDRMPLQAVASWSDGTIRDVTAETYFTSSNPAVAKVVSASLAVDSAKIFIEAGDIGTASLSASWSDGTSEVRDSRTVTVAARTTETRTIWVSRWNLGSSESAIRSNIQKFANSGFNAVYFQVMGDGTAYYASDLLPVKSTSLDSLAVAVDEAHKRGIQLHAYINALVAPKTIPTSGKHILVSHPEYICKDSSGNTVSDDGYTWVAAEDGYIEHYRKVVKEILDRYDVDGIHVDRIRSPTKDTCHSANLDAKYQQEKNAGTVSNWQQFYTNQVTKLAQAIYETVIANKPNVLVSFAVWGIYKRFSGCSTSQGVDYNQDTVAWMRMGIADAISPMTYWNFGAYNGCADWGKHADFFKANSYGRQVIMGMHAQDSGAVDVSKIKGRIDYARSLNLAGTAIFASNYFSDANWSSISSQCYASPADPTPIVHR